MQAGPPGSLTVVGTGIRLAVQLTPEARVAIEAADELLYLAADPVSADWLAGLHSRAGSLGRFYAPGRPRAEAYAGMVDEILARVRAGRDVCVAFYGHAGVFVQPGHEAIRRARAEGYAARMLAAPSAEDCLFADLGLDPGELGCQSYEATWFVLTRPRVETSALLLLWQVGVVGQLASDPPEPASGLPLLVEALERAYPSAHEVLLYEASPYVVCAPLVRRARLGELATVEVPPLATLVVPPAAAAEVDPTALARLGEAR